MFISPPNRKSLLLYYASSRHIFSSNVQDFFPISVRNPDLRETPSCQALLLGFLAKSSTKFSAYKKLFEMDFNRATLNLLGLQDANI
jgi:hypothetical protein